ncbi:hypothetical protein I5G39_022095 [Pseudomonas aeruginosa]|nr:hypothetical protein [Pseudomonas aeruginosa]
MKQMTFADAEYAGKRKQTRKELFLIEMGLFAFKGVEKSDRLEKESRILENVSSHTNKN